MSVLTTEKFALTDFKAAFEKQRAFFESGATRDYAFRAEQLKKLRQALREFEPEILQALFEDMQKPAFEAYSGEIGYVIDEINLLLKNLRSWMRPERVPTPLHFWPASSWVLREPYGVSLVLSPWNYPFQLLVAPLAGALAAGNTAILKPSEMAPRTAAVVEKLVKKTFSPELVTVVQGDGRTVVPAMMESVRFDYVFFTGSAGAGKAVARMAADKLIPYALELGGKSPAIVCAGANIRQAAKRIVWGKFFNAGQTCIAPDYVLVQESVQEEMISSLKQAVAEMFGADPLHSPHLAGIINGQRLQKMEEFIKDSDLVCGGQIDYGKLRMSPTIIAGIAMDHPVMQEEIFGPVLPVISFKTIESAATMVRQHPNPLSLYCFSKKQEEQQYFLQNLSFGGGAINDVVVQFTIAGIPFGGIGQSGVGKYHGKDSYEVFSHRKGIMKGTRYCDTHHIPVCI